MEMPQPQKEHEWLRQLVGEWSYEAEADMGPDKPAERSRGKESVRTLGDLWVLAEGEGEMPGGGTGHTLLTLGWDPERKRFTGTWIGSMMTHLWIYDGTLDPNGRVLTLESEGPSMTGDGTLATYRDVIEIVSRDERIMRSHGQSQDGGWQQFMTVRYRRTG